MRLAPRDDQPTFEGRPLARPEDVNILTESGIVRQDITSSLDGGSAVTDPARGQTS